MLEKKQQKQIDVPAEILVELELLFVIAVGKDVLLVLLDQFQGFEM